MTCLHGKTLAVRIIVAPTAQKKKTLSRFFLKTYKSNTRMGSSSSDAMSLVTGVTFLLLLYSRFCSVDAQIAGNLIFSSIINLIYFMQNIVVIVILTYIDHKLDF